MCFWIFGFLGFEFIHHFSSSNSINYGRNSPYNCRRFLLKLCRCFVMVRNYACVFGILLKLSSVTFSGF